MASRNTIREFVADNYYHVYNRGVEKRLIFLDDVDYGMFLAQFKKYLIGEKEDNKNRHKYTPLGDEVQLLSYCLMPNHFHLLLYQTSNDGIEKLMRRVMTGYAMYFNNRYNRVGSLFQGRYKASRINADAYLQHISRYIHLNPKNYLEWPYSSMNYYRWDTPAPAWLNTDHILSIFGSREEYCEFVDQYQDTTQELALLKWQLANNPDEQD